MNAIDIHKESLQWAYEILEMVMTDVTPEQAHQHPPGIANPIAATYAHALVDLDVIPSLLLQGNLPMYETTWKDRTGISEPQWASDFDWGRQVKVDLAAARAYGKAAHDAAQAYLDTLGETDLMREIDLTAQDLGVRTVSWCITALIASHLNNMAGEISVLKGIQGARGYPF